MNFQIGFFDLMWLAESVMPPQPIARSVCFDNFSDKHYHFMNQNERIHFFNYVKKLPGFDLKNEQCLHFHNRFNPDNQFLINGKFELYLHNGNYHSYLNVFIDKENIKKIKKICYEK